MTTLTVFQSNSFNYTVLCVVRKYYWVNRASQIAEIRNNVDLFYILCCGIIILLAVTFLCSFVISRYILPFFTRKKEYPWQRQYRKSNLMIPGRIFPMKPFRITVYIFTWRSIKLAKLSSAILLSTINTKKSLLTVRISSSTNSDHSTSRREKKKRRRDLTQVSCK